VKQVNTDTLSHAKWASLQEDRDQGQQIKDKIASAFVAYFFFSLLRKDLQWGGRTISIAF
jgi:hypothetical protein